MPFKRGTLFSYILNFINSVARDPISSILFDLNKVVVANNINAVIVDTQWRLPGASVSVQYPFSIFAHLAARLLLLVGDFQHRTHYVVH